MKKYNINEYIYIQITEDGWEHLRNTVGEEYIKHCIKTPNYEKLIDGEVWHKLQLHNVFNLLPVGMGMKLLFKTNIIICI